MVREITTDLFSALWVNSTSQYNTYSSSQLLTCYYYNFP